MDATQRQRIRVYLRHLSKATVEHLKGETVTQYLTHHLKLLEGAKRTKDKLDLLNEHIFELLRERSRLRALVRKGKPKMEIKLLAIKRDLAILRKRRRMLSERHAQLPMKMQLMREIQDELRTLEETYEHLANSTMDPMHLTGIQQKIDSAKHALKGLLASRSSGH